MEKPLWNQCLWPPSQACQGYRTREVNSQQELPPIRTPGAARTGAMAGGVDSRGGQGQRIWQTEPSPTPDQLLGHLLTRRWQSQRFQTAAPPKTQSPLLPTPIPRTHSASGVFQTLPAAHLLPISLTLVMHRLLHTPCGLLADGKILSCRCYPHLPRENGTQNGEMEKPAKGLRRFESSVWV